jgi:hypothetical protein
MSEKQKNLPQVLPPEPEKVPDRRGPQQIPEVFERGTLRVSQAFLDVLNGESEKMSAALQNPDNWPGIQRAAKEAQGKIREFEREMGIEKPIREISSADLDEIDELVRKANAPAPWYARLWRWLHELVPVCLVLGALAPLPNMQAQTCGVRIAGNSTMLICDSSRVCPSGYHLFTQLKENPPPSRWGELFGFGDQALVENTCVPNARNAPTGLIQGGQKVDKLDAKEGWQ